MKPTPTEFADQIGERQQHGDPRVFGLGRPPPDAEVGIIPPAPLQVVSVFDTRPIAAYDFVQTRSGISVPVHGAAPSFDLGPLEVPPGYTAVLRKIDLEFTPGIVVNSVANIFNFLSLVLLRDSAPIPQNQVDFYGSVQYYAWEPTHHVFGFWQTYGLRVIPPASLITPASLLFAVYATFYGTLIPSKSRDADFEIASPAILVHQQSGA